jgi:hypothetical protein
MPLRTKFYSILSERIKRADAKLQTYLCMENPSVHRQVLGEAAPAPATLGARLAGR